MVRDYNTNRGDYATPNSSYLGGEESEGKMTEVKVKQIRDPKTKVKINDGSTRIKEIKASIVSTPRVPVLAQVEVSDIWKQN
jgi:hypothetical protein